MRRHGGHYGGDSGGGGYNAYGGGAAQLHHQHQNSKTGYYQGRHQEQHLGEKEGGQHNNQWGWERDGPDKLPQTAMSPTAPFSDGKLFQSLLLLSYFCCTYDLSTFFSVFC